MLLDFFNSLRTVDRRVKVVMLGGFNDFPFAPALRLLKNSGLFDPSLTSTPYNVVLDGNTEALDHILLGRALQQHAEYDSVQASSEFATRVSEHDPLLVRVPITPELTGNFEIQRSGLVYNRSTRTYVGTVTLTNKSTAPISGPLELVLESLPENVQLSNATGVRFTSAAGGADDPTLMLPADAFAPGAAVRVTLQFRDFGNNFPFINYTLRVFKARP